MKFYAKVPKNAHHISYAPSDSDEYQEYLERGFVFDKLPSYRPKRITLFQALSSVAGLKASWNPCYISPVVHNNVAYATNGRILVWIDLSLVDESQKLSEGIHFNPDLWPGNLDKTENVEASICSLAESSWEGLNFLRQEKSGDADYVTRRFNPKHMPVLKKAAQSFYCIKPDLKGGVWASVNIPVCPTVHIAGASLYTLMDVFYSLMPGKQLPGVTAHLRVPETSGCKNNVYLSVDGFEFNRLGALIMGTDHVPGMLTYLWTDPDADSGDEELPRLTTNGGLKAGELDWGEARLVPAQDSTDPALVISVPGQRIGHCVQSKDVNGCPVMHFYCDEYTMRRFYRQLADYFAMRDAEKDKA